MESPSVYVCVFNAQIERPNTFFFTFLCEATTATAIATSRPEEDAPLTSSDKPFVLFLVACLILIFVTLILVIFF